MAEVEQDDRRIAEREVAHAQIHVAETAIARPAPAALISAPVRLDGAKLGDDRRGPRRIEAERPRHPTAPGYRHRTAAPRRRKVRRRMVGVEVGHCPGRLQRVLPEPPASGPPASASSPGSTGKVRTRDQAPHAPSSRAAAAGSARRSSRIRPRCQAAQKRRLAAPRPARPWRTAARPASRPARRRTRRAHRGLARTTAAARCRMPRPITRSAASTCAAQAGHCRAIRVRRASSSGGSNRASVTGPTRESPPFRSRHARGLRSAWPAASGTPPR